MELNLNEEDYQPACVELCPTGAMTFGNLNNKQHKVFSLSNQYNTFRLMEDIGSEPKVIYISEVTSDV